MDKLNALVGKLVGDVGAAFTGALIVLGDRLGLYKAMGDGTPFTPKELAKTTKLKERYVREWLSAQAAAGFVDYDDASGKFSLSPEQSMALAQEGSPAFFAGAFQIAQAMWVDEPKVAEAFKTGKGVGWHQHSTCLFRGTERFFRPGYNTNLIGSWIPALDGVEEKLKEGAVVADVGCGHGASTILMAQAYPKSKFFGFDYHGPSIAAAKEAAKKAGVDKRITFQKATAKDYPEKQYDLVAMFDCLHDMGDPVGAAKHVKKALAKDGTFLLVEPFAHDALTDNLNPVGRLYYSASTMLCTPASLSQEVGLGLGAQAGEARLREVATKAGFKHFRRATETPFNLVFEART
ncbi:MAG: methyltransferase domain-containing protein [Alphaproteobacteria bacterium]|nr:methyltransferase domain-containing protein [Alphaproteobacteria bacterium]MBL6938724.1 methyltransferase domain-containing protein [Alphaproteobacteria bacterium]MBL7097919.1 methyltransferase domain-containing protein [Alphaproteobacteria bacterium]